MGRTGTDAEVELEDGYFLGVSQVKDKPGGNSISQGKACRPCYTSVRKQAEGGRTERRVSDCDADLTVWANPMHELPSKSPTWGRNVRALVPLLCSLPGWVLPPRRGTLASPKRAAFQRTALSTTEAQAPSQCEGQAAPLCGCLTGTCGLSCCFKNILDIFI